MSSRIRRTLAVSLATACLIALTQTVSHAQTNLIPKPRIKAGVFMPNDGGLKDTTADTWIKLGADIGLPIVGLRAGIDYAFDGSNYVMPITLSQIFQPSAVVVKSPVYGGIGLGVWNAKHPGGSGTTLGARGTVGVEFGGYLLEANYDITGKVAGRRFDGLSLLVGKKF
jgi:hypothetical protein